MKKIFLVMLFCFLGFSQKVFADVEDFNPPHDVPYIENGITYDAYFYTYYTWSYGWRYMYYQTQPFEDHNPNIWFVGSSQYLGYVGNRIDCETTFEGETPVVNCNTPGWGVLNANAIIDDGYYSNRDIYNEDGSSVIIPIKNIELPKLTVTNDTDDGTVAISPTGSGASSHTYTVQESTHSFNDEVTLTATPVTGKTFAYWDDGQTCNTNNPITVTMSASKEIAPVFVPDPIILSFPLHNDCDGVQCTPYTEPVSSVFDHTATAEYTSDTNHHVTVFNGEASDDEHYYTGTTCYRKGDSSDFGSGFKYVGYGSAGEQYLCYDGHPGFDYHVVSGTDVYSAAAGTVVTAGYDSCLGNNITIAHGVYRTRYFHLYSINTTNVQVNKPIDEAGINIGKSGDTGSCSDGAHLHFQVEKKTGENWIPVDPYGWTGSGSDPYTRATNNTLWE